MPQKYDLKKRIADGEFVIGVSAPITSTKARLEQILGADDYGYLSVDSQHSPWSEAELVEFCGIAAELSTPVHFRIKHTRYSYQVGNFLDLGPACIEVPQVETEETAQEAIDYFYYAQFGKRSWGGAARWGVEGREDRLEYADWWNNHGVLWLQIESIQAVTNSRKFAKAGVDCLSWGPADLSFSREANPNHPLQTDDECVAYVVKQISGTDTKLVIRSYDPALRSKYQDMGVTVLLERPKV
jgi:2-keto-3-deoxy-L-rhamnonate aldolase RhmA